MSGGGQGVFLPRISEGDEVTFDYSLIFLGWCLGWLTALGVWLIYTGVTE